MDTQILDRLKEIRIEPYTYNLPQEKIARFPLPQRESSKLLLYKKGEITQSTFAAVKEILVPGQTLIFNNTKVIFARLFFQKETGGHIEVFCLEPAEPADYAMNFAARGTCVWTCLVGNLRKWREGEIFCRFSHEGRDIVLTAQKLTQKGGEMQIRFSWPEDLSFSEVLEACGKIPIPPYLNRDAEDSDKIRYQTVYSREEGSVAAPTAGLHFTEGILAALATKGVRIDELTLHVGAGTFRPVKAEKIGEHDMHTEQMIVSRQLIEDLARKSGDVIAVGTTSVRTLESLYWMGVKKIEGEARFYDLSQWEAYTLPSCYSLQQAMEALKEWFDETQEEFLKARTTIIIVPGYTYRVIDALFTNFHQPQSTLLLLVAAAVGEDWKRIYAYALRENFRFLSYGDTSLLWTNKPK